MLYQLITGLSDAIPALLLCIVIGYFTLKKTTEQVPKSKLSLNIITVCLIAAVFTAIRAIGYHTGIIGSDYAVYPIQTYIWTVLFGIGLGFIFVLLRPIYKNENIMTVKLSLLTIGLNWVIFNSFIGLIFKGLMWQMLLRSGLDIIPFFAITIFLNTLYKKSENRNIRKFEKENL